VSGASAAGIDLAALRELTAVLTAKPYPLRVQLRRGTNSAITGLRERLSAASALSRRCGLLDAKTGGSIPTELPEDEVLRN